MGGLGKSKPTEENPDRKSKKGKLGYKPGESGELWQATILKEGNLENKSLVQQVGGLASGLSPLPLKYY